MSETSYKIFQEYDWNMFKKACLEMNCTEFYSETYPLLGKYCDDYGYNKEFILKFINKAVKDEGKKYQDCLDDILTIILDGARYSHESIGCDIECIKYLLQKGAILPEERIFFSRNYYPFVSDTNFKPSYDDEIYDYHIRGKLIDVFHSQFNIKKYTDWSKIASKYWEHYINSEITEEKRYSYLKYCSKYLCETYPNVNDSDSDDIGIGDSDLEDSE